MEEGYQLHPATQVLAVLAAVPFFIWSTWTGVVWFRGGTVPLVGWTVEPSVWGGIIWFVVLEWFAFLTIVAIPLTLVVDLPIKVFGSLWRRRSA